MYSAEIGGKTMPRYFAVVQFHTQQMARIF